MISWRLMRLLHAPRNDGTHPTRGTNPLMFFQRLGAMKPGERMRADLMVTGRARPEVSFGPGTRPDDVDVNELYSATYEWLAEFVSFCRRSGGFAVY